MYRAAGCTTHEHVRSRCQGPLDDDSLELRTVHSGPMANDKSSDFERVASAHRKVQNVRSRSCVAWLQSLLTSQYLSRIQQVSIFYSCIGTCFDLPTTARSAIRPSISKRTQWLCSR